MKGSYMVKISGVGVIREKLFHTLMKEMVLCLIILAISVNITYNTFITPYKCGQPSNCTPF